MQDNRKKEKSYPQFRPFIPYFPAKLHYPASGFIAWGDDRQILRLSCCVHIMYLRTAARNH